MLSRLLKQRKRADIQRSLGRDGARPGFEAFRRHLEEKHFKKVGVIGREEREVRIIVRLIEATGGRVVFHHVLSDDREDVGLSHIDQIDQIVLAVLDTRVYRLRRRLLERKKSGKEIPEVIAPSLPYRPLEEDSLFTAIVNALADKTEWDVGFWQSWKSYGVYQLLRMALLHDGECFEFGCYRGYSAAFLAETMEALKISNKRIYLFDTWEGMPSADKTCDPFYGEGDFADTSIECMRRTLDPWRDRFEYVQGDICKTARLQRPRPLCYVRIDVDLYEPARRALEATYDWVVDGGIVYFDDYVSEKTVGERLAVDEVLAGRPERPFYMIGDRAYIIKGVP